MDILFTNILALAITSSIIILILLAIRLIGRKRGSSSWFYFVWLILALRMLVPVSIIPISFTFNQEKEAEVAYQEPIIQNEKSTPYKSQAVVESNEDISKNIISKPLVALDTVMKNNIIKISFRIISIIWITVAITLMVWQLFSIIMYRKKVLKYKRACEKREYLQVWERLKKKYNMDGISLYVCEDISSPMLTGIIKHDIIIPNIEYTKDEMKMILSHEMTHYKHHDSLYNLLLSGIKIIYWFCPFVYLLNQYAKEDMELYCDETVIAHSKMNERKAYSMAIIKTIPIQRNQNALNVSLNRKGDKNKVKKRIANILNNNGYKKRIIYSTILACAILIISCVGLNLLGKKNKVANAQEENPSVKELQEVKQETFEGVEHFLLLGIENIGGGSPRPDSIQIVSLDANNKKILVTSVARDLLVKNSQDQDAKLVSLYKSDSDELKLALEEQFQIKFGGVTTIDMAGFEKIIDSIGGITVEISENECNYLNSTNYISKKENRNLKPGENILNGNQALGYVRIRKINSFDGSTNGWGRDYRQQTVIESILEGSKKTDLDTLLEIVSTLLSSVRTDLDSSHMVGLITEFASYDYQLETESYPEMNDAQAVLTDFGQALKVIDNFEYKIMTMK